MNGAVDDDLRALLEVQIGGTPNGPEGAHPLLGTMLLDGHDLQVSYKRRTVTLN